MEPQKSDCALSMEASDKEETVEPQKKKKNLRKNNNRHHRWVDDEVKLLLYLFDSNEAILEYHSGKVAFCKKVAKQINLQCAHDRGYVDLDADSIKDKLKVIFRIHHDGNPNGKVSDFMVKIVDSYRARIHSIRNNSSSAMSVSDAPSSSVQGGEVSHVGAIRYLKNEGISDIQELRRYSIVLQDVHNRAMFAACNTFGERIELLAQLLASEVEPLPAHSCRSFCFHMYMRGFYICLLLMLHIFV